MKKKEISTCMTIQQNNMLKSKLSKLLKEVKRTRSRERMRNLRQKRKKYCKETTEEKCVRLFNVRDCHDKKLQSETPKKIENFKLKVMMRKQMRDKKRSKTKNYQISQTNIRNTRTQKKKI